MKPILGVSFPDDPADALRAFELLRANFKCDFEFASLYDLEEYRGNSESDMRQGWNLRHTSEAHEAFRQVTGEAQAKLMLHEQRGTVATAGRATLVRPNPNELAAYTRLARMLLAESQQAVDEGWRAAALRVAGVFNEQLKREGLLDLLITTSNSRKFYAAVRGCIPGLEVVQDPAGGRTYIRGVTWSAEAIEMHNPSPFRRPYS